MAKVEREILVLAPPDTAYQVWRNFENLPHIMDHIEYVRSTGARTSHWKAKGPPGATPEWDAEITLDEPGHAIAWRSLAATGCAMRTEGLVKFEHANGATRVHLMLDYEATSALAEPAEHALSSEHNVELALARCREIIERQAGTAPEGDLEALQRMARLKPYLMGTGTVTPVSRQRTGAARGEGDEPSQVKGRHHQEPLTPAEQPDGPGMPENNAPGRPTTTSTPGGALGAPTESDLKRNQADLSDRSDSRM